MKSNLMNFDRHHIVNKNLSSMQTHIVSSPVTAMNVFSQMKNQIQALWYMTDLETLSMNMEVGRTSTKHDHTESSRFVLTIVSSLSTILSVLTILNRTLQSLSAYAEYRVALKKLMESVTIGRTAFSSSNVQVPFPPIAGGKAHGSMSCPGLVPVLFPVKLILTSEYAW